MPPERVHLEQRESPPPGGERTQSHRKHKGQVVSINPAAGMVWRGPEYPLLDPGVYVVRAVKVQGPEWVRSFCRWSLRVEFALTTEPGFVSAFFNLGKDKSTQHIGRQSRYFKAWTIANGDLPRKGQPMNADVFLNGQFFEVQVDNCANDSSGNPKPEAEVYSRVTRVLKAWTV